MGTTPSTEPFRQTKFNTGEISPQMYGDTTWAKYSAALRTCRNAIPLPEGAWLARPGTKYIAATKTAGVQARLIPFIFSDNTTFVLEFGNNYIRFYNQGFYVNTIYGVGTGPYYELVTPYTTAMLPYLKYKQIGNVITICYGGQVPGVAALAPMDLLKTSGALGPWSLGNTITSTATVSWPVLLLGLPVFGGQIYPYNTSTIYNVGDRVTTTVSGAVIDWTCIQSNVIGGSQSPPTALAINGALTGLAGNLFWTPSMDAAHPAVNWKLGLTVVYQDSTGVTYETPVSASWPFLGVIAPDRALPVRVNASPFVFGTVLYYKYYRGQNNVFGFISQIPYITAGVPYVDLGNTPDYTQQPPLGTDPFVINGTDNYPACIGYIDQRRAFAGQALVPNAIQTSQTGNLYRFDQPIPGAASDATTIVLASEVLEQIRSLISQKCNLVFTAQGEWVFPDAPYTKASSPRQASVWGSSWIDPIKLGNGCIFNTSKSNQVRDFFPLYGLYTSIWDGNDLTENARHFFERHTIVSWAVQTVPYPVIWMVREDGALLSMTYVRATQDKPGVVAWAQHNTGSGNDGFEGVCVVPEPPEDALYCIVRRVVNGTSVRYIERFNSPIPALDQRLSSGLDSSLLFDGRNVSTNMYLTSLPGTYNVGDQVTITLAGTAGSSFVPGDAGTANVVFDSENVLGLGTFQAKVLGYTDANHVTAELQSTLTFGQSLAWMSPTGFLKCWGIARAIFSVPSLLNYALDDGTPAGARGVAALVDAQTTANVTFAAGVLSLTSPGLIVRIGLLYNSDMGLLDVYSPNNEIRNRYKEVKRLGFEVANSRSIWVGPDFGHLTEWEERDVLDSYNIMGLATGYFSEFILSEWNISGAAVLRHFNPLPCIVVSVLREVSLGGN